MHQLGAATLSHGVNQSRLLGSLGGIIVTEAAAQVSFLNMNSQLDIPEMVPDDGPHYPEQRLWHAVILNFLVEYEVWLRRIELEWNRNQEPVNRTYRAEVLSMRMHCEHRWFRMICDLADIQHQSVMNRVARLEKDYCFCAIPFDTTSIIVSNWQQRKRRSRSKRLKVK